MTTMISEVYDAIKEAGASYEKAKQAAQAVAQHGKDTTEIKASLLLLKWIIGFNLAFTMAVLWKVFT